MGDRPMKAFPKLNNSYKDHRTDCEVYQYEDDGMDLRDYFAAKVMSSIIISQGPLAVGYEIDVSELSKDSYKIADAMMEARK